MGSFAYIVYGDTKNIEIKRSQIKKKYKRQKKWADEFKTKKKTNPSLSSWSAFIVSSGVTTLGLVFFRRVKNVGVTTENKASSLVYSYLISPIVWQHR